MLKMIVAMDCNRGIGLRGKMPWHILEEMNLFKKITMNHSVVFGRTTFENMSSLLKNRKHYVVTRNRDFFREGISIVHDFDAFLNQHQNSVEEIYICGGTQIYQQAFPYVSELHLSILKNAYECDTFLPYFDLSEFTCDVVEDYELFTYYHYKRENICKN